MRTVIVDHNGRLALRRLESTLLGVYGGPWGTTLWIRSGPCPSLLALPCSLFPATMRRAAPSSTPFCHGASVLGPAGHGLNPLGPFSLKRCVSGILPYSRKPTHITQAAGGLCLQPLLGNPLAGSCLLCIHVHLTLGPVFPFV